VIFKLSLPSVGKKALGKELFAKCCICDTRQRGKETLCRVWKIKHSAKSIFAECFLLPRVFAWHSTKSFFVECPKKTLCKEPNSGSDGTIKFPPRASLRGGAYDQVPPSKSTRRGERPSSRRGSLRGGTYNQDHAKQTRKEGTQAVTTVTWHIITKLCLCHVYNAKGDHHNRVPTVTTRVPERIGRHA
jgi:hypothetical protein